MSQALKYNAGLDMGGKLENIRALDSIARKPDQ